VTAPGTPRQCERMPVALRPSQPAPPGPGHRLAPCTPCFDGSGDTVCTNLKVANPVFNSIPIPSRLQDCQWGSCLASCLYAPVNACARLLPQGLCRMEGETVAEITCGDAPSLRGLRVRRGSDARGSTVCRNLKCSPSCPCIDIEFGVLA
jgi:hypothetical protein